MWGWVGMEEGSGGPRSVATSGAAPPPAPALGGRPPPHRFTATPSGSGSDGSGLRSQRALRGLVLWYSCVLPVEPPSGGETSPSGPETAQTWRPPSRGWPLGTRPYIYYCMDGTEMLTAPVTGVPAVGEVVGQLFTLRGHMNYPSGRRSAVGVQRPRQSLEGPPVVPIRDAAPHVIHYPVAQIHRQALA